MPRVSRAFFQKPTPVVARGLLGCRLVRVRGGKRLAGTVVETEAYRGASDPASHAYGGKTKRNEVMFGRAGHAYVYFIYGFHNCLNVTTEPEGRPGAVLIRAIEPVEGVSEMLRNRGPGAQAHLTDGPGRVTKALCIDRSMNGEDMVASRRLYIETGRLRTEVASSPRVGVRDGGSHRWRFYALGNRFVSAPRWPRPQRIHN